MGCEECESKEAVIVWLANRCAVYQDALGEVVASVEKGKARSVLMGSKPVDLYIELRGEVLFEEATDAGPDRSSDVEG